MNFPQSCRVVVIDDIPAEVQPVIEAFGKLAVGCIYLRGDRQEDLPDKPLSGVRLVVLDMRLGTTGGDQAAKMTATVFTRVVSAEEGPLVVLLWTKHKEDVDEFRTALFALNDKFRSMLLIADLEKPVAPGEKDANRIVNKLKALARGWAPMNVVWHWEQLAHDAASATTVLVAEQVTDTAGIDAADNDTTRRNKWLARLRAVLRQLATAAGGRAGTAKSAHADLLETFIALHGDRVEHALSLSGKVDLGGLFVDPPGSITAAHAAKLNSMLLLAAAVGEPGELRPGNAYFRKAGAKRNVLFTRTGFKPRALAEEIVERLTKDEDYRKHADAAKPAKDAPRTQAQRDAEARRRKRLTELFDKCVPVLVELSPTCDFSQQKRCVVRLAGGLLVPGDMMKFVDDKKESLRIIPHAVHIPGRTGEWTAVFSGQFLFSVSLSKDFAATKPDFRFRSQVLGDLRNWYSAQAARLGYLAV